MQYLYFALAFLLSPSPSGFFSGSETALALTTRNDGAIKALAEKPQQTLLSILFMNHWSNTIPVMVVSSWATMLFGPMWALGLGFAHGFHQLYFGEMLAKAYSQLYANKVAGFVSPILVPIVAMLGPWLIKIAPKKEKTAAEKCLEERLKAEADADRLDALVLLKTENVSLPQGTNYSIKVSAETKISIIERRMMRMCTEKATKEKPKHLMMADFYIRVVKYPEVGESEILGHLHSSAFQFKDWDHNN